MSALSREIGVRGRADAVAAADAPEPQTDQPSPSSLRDELAGLKVSALHKRALADGASAEATEDAMDDDSPKAALIELILSLAGSGGNSGEAELRQELEGLRLKELRARARSEECDDGAMAEAMDSDDPKAAFVQLLLGQARR